MTHQSETTASMTGSHSKLTEYPMKMFKKSSTLNNHASADTALIKDLGKMNINGTNTYKIKPTTTSTKLDGVIKR
jgi:hypothetical protein